MRRRVERGAKPLSTPFPFSLIREGGRGISSQIVLPKIIDITG